MENSEVPGTHGRHSNLEMTCLLFVGGLLSSFFFIISSTFMYNIPYWTSLKNTLSPLRYCNFKRGDRMSKRPSKFESVSARNEDSSSGSATHQEAAPTTNVESTTTPSYIVELAKSGRAECKKCGDKIDNKTIRIGVILEGDWGLFTRWQHLSCTVFHASLTSCNAIDGLQDLSREDQIAVENRYESSKGEIDEDMKPLDPDALVRKTWDEAIEPCSDLLMPLLPYQKEGLGWMLHQELSNIHGGILADEMGMGMFE